jgi:ribose transport system substrate-binding protein
LSQSEVTAVHPIRLGLSLFLLAALGSGCTRDAADDVNAISGGGGKTWRIAVIPKGTSHDFWNNVEAGAQQGDAEFDDVEITWKGPLTEEQASEQIRTVDNFIVDGYDGICLAPLDATALRGPVERALDEKIPVVIFDSALNDASGTLSYIASDNLRGGRLAGEYLAELLGGKGKVILLRYQLNSASTDAREQGFLEVIATHEGIEIISDDLYGGPDEAAAIEKAANLLQNFGDVVDGIFCPNESTTSGMLIELRRSRPDRVGQIKFVGFDAGENLINGLEAGHLHGTVLQDPVQMGYESVRVMREHLSGNDVQAHIPTRLHVAKYDALDDPVTAELLRPRENHKLLKASEAN